MRGEREREIRMRRCTVSISWIQIIIIVIISCNYLQAEASTFRRCFIAQSLCHAFCYTLCSSFGYTLLYMVMHTLIHTFSLSLAYILMRTLRCVFRHSLLYILIHTLLTFSCDLHLLYMFTVYILVLAYTLYCKRQIPGKQSPHVDSFVQFLSSKDGQKDAIVSINQDQWRSFVQFSKQVLSL